MIKIILFLVSITLIGCGGGKDKILISDNSINNKSTMVRSIAIRAGDVCDAGGVEIESGIDADGDGKLDDDEVTITKIICHGETGYNSLVKITDEPEGDNCAAAGKKISTGKDTNRDGTLNTDEIEDAQFICNGFDGAEGKSGASTTCGVVDNNDGTKTLSCNDETSVIINDGAKGETGATGETGAKGETGATGASTTCGVKDNGDGTKTLSCNDGSSVTINDGVDGTNGTDGSSCSVEYILSTLMKITCDDGTSVLVADGKDGVDNRITSTLYCSGTLEGVTGINWIYRVRQFSSGDIFVSGEVRDGEIAVSSATMFSSLQVGYSEAPIFISFDLSANGVSNGGYWKITLDRSTLITSIEYNDVDVAPNPSFWPMTADRCIHNEFSQS